MPIDNENVTTDYTVATAPSEDVAYPSATPRGPVPKPLVYGGIGTILLAGGMAIWRATHKTAGYSELTKSIGGAWIASGGGKKK